MKTISQTFFVKIKKWSNKIFIDIDSQIIVLRLNININNVLAFIAVLKELKLILKIKHKFKNFGPRRRKNMLLLDIKFSVDESYNANPLSVKRYNKFSLINKVNLRNI